MGQKKIQAIQLAEEAVAAGTVEDPLEFWNTLTRAMGYRNLLNEGRLLAQLFTIAPVKDSDVAEQFGEPILRHLVRNDMLSEDVLRSFPKVALRLRRDLGIPVSRVRPLLEGLDADSFVMAVTQDPELYEPQMGQRLFELMDNESGKWRVIDVLMALPDFRKAFIVPLLPRVICLYHGDIFEREPFIDVLSDEERERLAMCGLEKAKNSYFQIIWKFSHKALSTEAQARVNQAVKTAIQKTLEERASQDPIEAYLNGQIGWGELEFAQTDPSGYRAYQFQSRWRLNYPHPWRG